MIFEIPLNVRDSAKSGLYLKKQGYEGGTATGIKRANQLAKDKNISINDLRSMRNWFARHVITSYPSFEFWKDMDYKKEFIRPGTVAWLLWGGDDAFNWVNKPEIINLLNQEFGTNYKKIRK